MKTLRSIIFWCHLAVGVIVAAVVVIMSATGVALTYQKQMQYWADTRGMATGPTTPGAARLSVDSLLTLVQASTGSAPTSVTVRSANDSPVEVALGQRRVFVNAYTGAVLGEGSARMRQFFSVMTSWHRWLGQTGEHRNTGRAITGFSNAGFFFIVLSGLYLWFPRVWSRVQFRNVMAFRRGLRGKARDFNWHNTIGFWSFIPLVLIVGSGVVMSYPWANALVYRSVGEQVPTGGGRGGEGGRGGGPGGGSFEGRGGGGSAQPRGGREPIRGIDSVLAVAEGKVPAWRSLSAQLPAASAKTVSVSADAGMGGQPQLRSTLTIDRATSTTTKIEEFSSQSRGRRLRSFLRFAHTGEYYGAIGQTIAGLVSFGAVVLAYTGIALALRRLWAWRRRRSRAATLDPQARSSKAA